MNKQITFSSEFKRLMDLLHNDNLKDPTAQYELAVLFLKRGQANDLKEAFARFKELSRRKYTPVQTDARFMLGKCYENGFGIQKSYPRAIRWYEAVGKNISSDLIYNPDPVGERAAKALNEITKGRDFDEALDEILYGKTSPESIDCITEAAEAGDVDAQKYLMDLYNLGGRHIPIDEEEALYWAQKAAENGNTEAMEHLGKAYYYGKNVEKDIRLGLYWLEKAAKEGSEYAPHILGEFCLLEKRSKEAAAWYRIYAERQIAWRNKRLGWENGKKPKETD